MNSAVCELPASETPIDDGDPMPTYDPGKMRAVLIGIAVLVCAFVLAAYTVGSRSTTETDTEL